jgi:hypothetical protein
MHAVLALAAAVLMLAGLPAATGAAPQQRPGAAASQVPATPARDARGGAVATAVLHGRVMSADGKAPIRRARLALQSASLQQTRLASTDLDGRFEFAELPAGRYRLSATKGSYVPTEYSQRRPSQPGTAIELAAGQTIERVEILMSQGAVITGQVLDDIGDPAAFMRVGAMRRVYRDGRPRLEPVGHVVETNDIGQYRLFGLAPGSYYVAASGTVWSVEASPRSEAPTFAPTYYPGTMNVAEAQRVKVDRGEERPGVDLALRPIRAVRVSGTAFDSSGRPLDSVHLLSLDPIGGVAATGGMGIGAATVVRPDGTFAIGSVAPGEYILAGLARDARTGESESAGMRVWVAGEEVSGLALVTTAGARVTGRIVTDGGSSPPFGTKEASVATEPVGDVISAFLGGVGRIADDWSFEVKGVAGRRRVTLRLPSGWALKAVLLDGRDVTDEPLDIRGPDPVEGLRVVVTNLTSVIEGQVTDERGRPVKDYSVVVFPPDAARWAGSSRFLGTATPDQYGRYKLSALPAGEYLAVAVDFLDEGEFGDPEFLEAVRGVATKLTLGDGEAKVLDLKLVKRGS